MPPSELDEDANTTYPDGVLADLLVDDEDQVPNHTTKATLDMIITVVGEIYGQRDLLEHRITVGWVEMGEQDHDLEEVGLAAAVTSVENQDEHL